jgi:hypothetical protein
MKIKSFKTMPLLIAFIFMGCDTPIDYEVGKKHALRKFNIKTTSKETSSASYFLVMGSYSSSKTEFTTGRFYYQNCLGEFQLMELPLNRIRIKIDSTQAPFVEIKPEFINKYRKCYEILDGYYVESVTIHCGDSDFQPEISINDLR